MLYAPVYVRLPRESFGTDQDGLLLRARGRARRARLGPVFPVRGHIGGPQGTPHAPRPRGALQVTAHTRRRPGHDGGRRHGGDHTVSDDRLAGDVARRDRPRLRRGGGPEDRLIRKRGAYGDPAGTQRAWGFPREGQGSPATRA